jgi:hypothetical protein
MRKFSSIVVLLFLFALPGHAQEVVTVVAEGLGRDIESAVQMAAEAALTEVVGSFIDSDKRIEKRKQIKDGIKTQTKTITSKISEYSQGSIQRLDVLEVEDDDGLTRVTAKVTVRIEDFKHYIKETVLAEKKIKKGLLGTLKVKKKQAGNLADLLINKVLQPVLDYQVMIPKIVSDIQEMEQPEIIQMLNPGDEEHVIYFAVQVDLNPDYLANAERVLQETAETRFEMHNYPGWLNGGKKGRDRMRKNHSVVIAIGTPFGPNLQYIHTRSPFLEFAKGHNNGIGLYFSVMPVFYAFPGKDVNLCTKLRTAVGLDPQYWYNQLGDPWRLSNGATFVRDGILAPKLRMQFVSAEGTTLRDEVIFLHKPGWATADSGFKSNFSMVLANSDTTPPDLLDFNGVDQPEAGAWFASLLRLDSDEMNSRDPRNCGFFISRSTNFIVVTKVSETVLGNAEKITVEYVK